MEKVASPIVYSEYLQWCYPYIINGKTPIIIITTAELKMEMSSVPQKAQECQFSDCEGSLNFLKYFMLLSLNNPRFCTKF